MGKTGQDTMKIYKTKSMFRCVSYENVTYVGNMTDVCLAIKAAGGLEACAHNDALFMEVSEQPV